MKHGPHAQYCWRLAVAAALALAACDQQQPPAQESSARPAVTTESNQDSEPAPAQGAQPEAGTLTVVGTLTGEGVECPAVRGDDGALYTLVGDIGTAAAGDHVRVTGTAVEVSICMQGNTLRVVSVEKMP